MAEAMPSRFSLAPARVRRPRLHRNPRRAGAPAPHRSPHTYFPAPAPLLEGGKASGAFGPLSPIVLTLANSSLMLMPESVSKSAGTCAAILVMSPVILFIPDASPFPVETIVIL